MKPQRILISLVNWNRYEDTIKCVNSIKDSVYNNYEIRIVDNDSTNDSFIKLKEQFKSIDIVKSTCNNGYASGHYINVQYAISENFDFVWILNSDVVAQPNTLNHLVNAYNKYGDHIYGSVTTKEDNTTIDFYGYDFKGETNKILHNQNKIKTVDELDLTEVREVYSVEGSAMFIPLSLIKKYGFMKLDFFMYGEETDYCYRLRKENVKSIIVNASIITHVHGVSLNNSNIDLKWISAYYRRRNSIRIHIDLFHESRIMQYFKYYSLIDLLGVFFKWITCKQVKNTDFWLLKATLHAVFNVKGKTIDPEIYYNKPYKNAQL